VPAGEYLLTDPTGTHPGGEPVVERFHCAAGPAGWRYTSVLAPGGERVDLTLDARGRQVRVEVVAGGWRVRGGTTGRRLLWVRSPAGGQPVADRPAGRGTERRAEDGTERGTERRAEDGTEDGTEHGPEPGTERGTEHDEEAAGFTGASAGFLAAADRLLRLSAGLATGVPAALRLVLLSPPVLGTSVVTQRWTLTGTTEHETDLGVLPVRAYEVLDLGTGVARRVHVGGDVVLDAAGVVLQALDGPPSLP